MTRSACEQARSWLFDEQRGRLPVEQVLPLREHLQQCAECARLDQQERTVTELLRTRLIRPSAPDLLKQRLGQQALAAQVPTSARPQSLASRRILQLSGVGLALAACALLGLSLRATRSAETAAAHDVVREAVNDHLRVLYAANPIEVESGGIHRVKPWFTGRIDFAPDVTFSGDDEFPLIGGAVGYMLDRKAATFVFKRRLHTITMLVFRADGLEWPDGATQSVGPHRVQLREHDGFHVVLWKSAGLGHALISDVSSSELLQLCAKLDPQKND
jgi:anti-sigma factor RsiW